MRKGGERWGKVGKVRENGTFENAVPFRLLGFLLLLKPFPL